MAKPRRDPRFYCRILVYADTRDKLRDLAEWMRDDMIAIADEIVSLADKRYRARTRLDPSKVSPAGSSSARLLVYASTRDKLRELGHRCDAPMTVLFHYLVSITHADRHSPNA